MIDPAVLTALVVVTPVALLGVFVCFAFMTRRGGVRHIESATYEIPVPPKPIGRAPYLAIAATPAPEPATVDLRRWDRLMHNPQTSASGVVAERGGGVRPNPDPTADPDTLTVSPYFFQVAPSRKVCSDCRDGKHNHMHHDGECVDPFCSCPARLVTR